MAVTRWIGVFSCAGLLLATTAVSTDDALRIQVSPAVSRAPAVLTIRVTVEPSADNRSLQVVAESATFYRSSEIVIDGTSAPPLQVLEFQKVPAGLYQVTAVLVGAQGPRATVQRLVKVEPATGSP